MVQSWCQSLKSLDRNRSTVCTVLCSVTRILLWNWDSWGFVLSCCIYGYYYCVNDITQTWNIIRALLVIWQKITKFFLTFLAQCSRCSRGIPWSLFDMHHWFLSMFLVGITAWWIVLTLTLQWTVLCFVFFLFLVSS